MGRLKALPSRLAALGPAVKPPPKVADVLYRSTEWKALVARVKAERGAWCVRCGSGRRVIADHIVEVKDGGAPFDPSNLQLLCHACHNAKTADARAARAGGRSKV
jgi:5-methylcytosine-specific restriction enzyme A